jgi:hypothetical protein
MFELNKLNKQQKRLMEKEMSKEIITSLKNYFTGDNGWENRGRFLVRYVSSSIKWSFIFSSIVIMAIIATLFIVPGHTHIMNELRSSYMRHPISFSAANTFIVTQIDVVLRFAIMLGAAIAAPLSLEPIVGTARDKVKSKWVALVEENKVHV